MEQRRQSKKDTTTIELRTSVTLSDRQKKIKFCAVEPVKFYELFSTPHILLPCQNLAPTLPTIQLVQLCGSLIYVMLMMPRFCSRDEESAYFFFTLNLGWFDILQTKFVQTCVTSVKVFAWSAVCDCLSGDRCVKAWAEPHQLRFNL